MSLWKLRLSMLGTLAILIGVPTAFSTACLQCFGTLRLIAPRALGVRR